MRQTQLNSQAQTLLVNPEEAPVDTATRRRRSVRRSIRNSTSKRPSGTILRDARKAAASSLEVHASPVLFESALQRPSETAPEAVVGSEPLTMDNTPATEFEFHQPPNTQEVCGSIEISMDSQRPISMNYSESSKTRERPGARRVSSRRNTRSSLRLSGVAENPSLECLPTVEQNRSLLLSDQYSHNFLNAETPCDGAVIQPTHNIATIRATEEDQNPARSTMVNEAVGPKMSAEDHLEQPPVEQLEEDLQPAVQPAEPADTLLQAESATATMGSLEQLSRTTAQEHIQTTELDIVESPIGNAIISEAESPEQISEQVAEPCSPEKEEPPADILPLSPLISASVEVSSSLPGDKFAGICEHLEPSTELPADDTSTLDSITIAMQASPRLPIVGPSSSDPVPAVPDNVPSGGYLDDDTDMLRKFLTRVKASKAAKAENATPQRKRSLPHSPLRLPLGDMDANASPSPLSLKAQDEVRGTHHSPSTKRRKRDESVSGKEDAGESKTIRRSGRTRLPLKATPSAPSLIPVRRLGQEGDSTVTLRRTEDKELAALTRVNTRKNKGALSPVEVLILKAAEKTDPVLKQRLLKEMFEEKQKKAKKNEKGKTVAWATELAQFQSEKKEDKEKGKEKMGSSCSDKKENVVKVAAARSKTGLGKPVNGTPGPKRRMRERA